MLYCYDSQKKFAEYRKNRMRQQKVLKYLIKKMKRSELVLKQRISAGTRVQHTLLRNFEKNLLNGELAYCGYIILKIHTWIYDSTTEALCACAKFDRFD